MLIFTATFPLGVYYALDAGTAIDGAEPPEWPPSPVRLIGALLAAAHEVPSDDLDADRAVLRKICESSTPPALVAPSSQENRLDAMGSGQGLSAFRGVCRWVPRNPERSEIKAEKGISPTKLQIKLAPANKSGTAIGDRVIGFVWDSVDLNEDELDRLNRIVANVSWLGTSRSPVLLQVFLGRGERPSVDADRDQYTRAVISALAATGGEVAIAAASGHGNTWLPLSWADTLPGLPIRVPTGDLINQFDRAHEARRSVIGKLEKAGLMNPASAGAWVNYVPDRGVAATATDPHVWDNTPLIVSLDRAGDSYSPSLEDAYLVTRSLRNALLATFENRGQEGDAPGLLRARGNDPHVAITPLANVGYRHSTGAVIGAAIWFPAISSEDTSSQRERIAHALAEFMPNAEARRSVRVEGRGPIWLAPPPREADRLEAASAARYARPSRYWLTVTPLVHSRWRTSSGPRGAQRQVEADFRDAGIPVPVLALGRPHPYAWRGAGVIRSGPGMPKAWRTSIAGPRSHWAFKFEEPVRGPIILGRGRHFGVGLCVPVSKQVWEEVAGYESPVAEQDEFVQ